RRLPRRAARARGRGRRELGQLRPAPEAARLSAPRRAGVPGAPGRRRRGRLVPARGRRLCGAAAQRRRPPAQPHVPGAVARRPRAVGLRRARAAGGGAARDRVRRSPRIRGPARLTVAAIYRTCNCTPLLPACTLPQGFITIRSTSPVAASTA